MVGIINYVHRIGKVAIFATLFVAIQVNGNGCVFDFEREDATSEFDLSCDGLPNEWSILDTEKNSDSSISKALFLEPYTLGCLKTKSYTYLNSSLRIVCTFNRELSEENPLFNISLSPKEGGECPYDECVWNVADDPYYETGKWITLHHSFPLKTAQEYSVKLRVGKGGGKFLLDHITLPNVMSGFECRKPVDLDNEIQRSGIPDFRKISNPIEHVEGNGTGEAPSIMEISKNLMLTSASVLTLNNLIN